MDRFESVFASVAGADVVRRSREAARLALADVRSRADVLRGRTDEFRDRVDEARDRANTAVDRANAAIDRANAAIDRLGGTIARFRRPRTTTRRGPAARIAASVTIARPTTVLSAMRPVLATVDVDDPICEAGKRLADAPDAHLVALEGDRVAGVVTGRHLLRAVAERLDPTTAAIGDVMTATMTSIPPTATLDEASVLVKYLRADELVVCDDGRPVGVLLATDVPRRA